LTIHEKTPLRSIIQSSVLVGDGAMGTYLYQTGWPAGISYEELNLTHPDVIEAVHRQYYDAGARLIETNTFAANRHKLSKYGLADQMEQINQAGVEIARRSVGQDAYIVAAIGSTSAGSGDIKQKQNREQVLREHIEILVRCDIDGILFESFARFDELYFAVKTARALTDLPIICQFALEHDGHTSDGVTLSQAFHDLIQVGADLVGLNCRSGPVGIVRVLQGIGTQSVPFSVFPNAGFADYVDGRYVYQAKPEYFAEKTRTFVEHGVRIIGGCCGTTPAHIQAISEALRDLTVPDWETQVHPVVAELVSSNIENNEIVKTNDAQPEIPSIVDLVKERHTVIVELDPPRDLDISRFMEGAKALQDVSVDALTMADNSLAMTRMSNLAMGQLVKQQYGVRPLLHIACRDRNLIGTQSHLMGLHALGIDHVLAVTGDPAKFGDLPGSKNVYELTSFEVIRLIKQLNDGYAFSGKQMKHKANFKIGAAFNPNVRHLEKAVERLERKVACGADYVMTQPIYDPRLIERLHDLTRHLNIPIFIGIMPLANGRNAEYLHNEVPGIELSQEVRQRMHGLEGEQGRAVGIKIAEELLDVTMNYFNGIYLITPFLHYPMSVSLTQYVQRKQNIHP
jgi:methionine synthase I (cobalamin-dependent)/5,10-methylenetetrahydrofolate reductase